MNEFEMFIKELECFNEKNKSHLIDFLNNIFTMKI